MHSALYHGWVSHRRRAPRPHEFRYRTFMVWLDLAELDEVFRGRWLWSTSRPAPARFARSDYLGPADRPLDVAVRDLVEARTGARPQGAVRMLTHLRYFGHCFNPLTLYYCYDPRGALECVVGEVTNMPWRERFAYALPVRDAVRDGGRLRFSTPKALHVSPFMPMDMDYEWRLNDPAELLEVAIGNRRHGEGVFDASLCLRRRPLDGRHLAAALAGFPLLSATIVAMIHWQALKLWLKGTPFHPHPGRG